MVVCECLFLIVDVQKRLTRAAKSNFLFFLVLFSLSFGSNDGAPPDFTIQNDENPQRRKRARTSPLVDTRNTETLKIRANVHRKIPLERVRAKKSFKIGSRIACRSIAKEKTLSGKKTRLTEREGEMSSFISLSLSLSLFIYPRATKETRISHLASLEYGLTSSPPPPMLSLLGASPYPPPAPVPELVEFPPRLLRLIANNFVVVSFMSPSFASNTERTTIGSKSGNMSSSVRHAASNDGPSLIFFSFGSQGRLLTYFVGKSLSLFVQKQERDRERQRERREKKSFSFVSFFSFL